MYKVRIMVWLICLIVILVLFNINFGMVYSPAGSMGDISLANVIASTVYLSLWLVMSIYSGIKRRKDIFVAALIYALLPAVGFMGTFFIGTPIAYLSMLLFYSMVPIQGIFAGNEQLTISATIIIMPVMLLLGYFISQKLKYRMRV
ncbi:MAG TPA: hypothetical protein VJY54_03200 [Lachnospiraceae bacterium]|nr:hypothetical protein [Lachnospiraceae bacterium]